VAVDHHLLNIVVGEQLLERPEPDRVTKDQLGYLLTTRSREDASGLVDDLANRGLERNSVDGSAAATIHQPQAQVRGDDASMIVGRIDIP
jgi:hypothetical protein